MKVLKINSVGGFYQEMFQPDTEFYKNELKIFNNMLDANSFFWSKHFSEERILNLINLLDINKSVQHYVCPQYRGILADRSLFINKVLEAPSRLCYDTESPQDFYSCLETISVLCKLYSDFEYHPFEINVQNGFVLNETSSKTIYNECLSPKRNPYFNFVLTEIMPLIYKEEPDILFLYGPMSFYFATIALLAKQKYPNVHICLSRHSSEYYSLNKITNLLKNNKFLFKIIDSLVLEYYDEIEEKIVSSLNNNCSLQDVPNIIYKNNDDIIETSYQPPNPTNIINTYYRMNNSEDNSKKVYDVHFEPYVKCYWNKCTFCGINKKYRYNDFLDTSKIFKSKISRINSLSKKCDYIWFVDEAIKPDKLKKIANSLLESKTKIVWQARCRADKDLLENGLPELLSKAGLKELRIGLESASYRILKLMNKFENDFSLDLIESIVETYDRNGISIHCPMILGFPQETDGERQITYEFLSKLSKKYKSFSFNLNILNLDVSSDLYKKWQDFQLQGLEYPCEPQNFIGNSIAWISSNYHKKLSDETNSFTRENLFPWMPVGSMISPIVLYRLCETSRNTLRWKTQGKWKSQKLFSADMELTLSEDIAKTVNTDNTFFYHWDTHHHMIGNEHLSILLNEFSRTQKVSIAIKHLNQINPDVFKKEELLHIIKKLFDYGFLEGNYVYSAVTDTKLLAEEYDKIYLEKNYFYNIEPDELLVRWEPQLKVGNVLDLGVGLGKNIDFLIERGFKPVGVDLSSVAIKLLNEKYKATNSRFYVGDIRYFNIVPNTYSLIICSLSLSYLTDEELIVLSQKIIDGLIPGGFLYINDLSKRDPLFNVPKSRTTNHRNFFTCSKVIKLFSELEIYELTDVYKKDFRRIGCENAFGLINFLGRKPKK